MVNAPPVLHESMVDDPAAAAGSPGRGVFSAENSNKKGYPGKVSAHTGRPHPLRAAGKPYEPLRPLAGGEAGGTFLLYCTADSISEGAGVVKKKIAGAPVLSGGSPGEHTGMKDYRSSPSSVRAGAGPSAAASRPRRSRFRTACRSTTVQ